MFAICSSYRIFSRRSFSSGVRSFLAMCFTSCVMLLFYTSWEVYTKFGTVSPEKYGFTYNPQQDAFVCPEGKLLTYHRLNCNQSTGKYLRCYQAVSYTHLDVYKRQCHDRAGGAPLPAKARHGSGAETSRNGRENTRVERVTMEENAMTSACPLYDPQLEHELSLIHISRSAVVSARLPRLSARSSKCRS